MKTRKPVLKKWTYDFILCICMLLAVAACLIYSYILESPRITVFLARPDTYMALWLILLAVLSLMLMRRALAARKTEEGQREGAPIWYNLGVFTVAVMFLYLLLLNKLGFFLASALMLWTLSGVYTFRIGAVKKDFRDIGVLVPALVKTGIFSVAASYLTFWIFTNILSAKLPAFSLF